MATTNITPQGEEIKWKTKERVEQCSDTLLKCGENDTILPCIDGALSTDVEKNIVAGTMSCSGEVANAISDEQVKLNALYLAQNEEKNTLSLLCRALDTVTTYNSISACLSVKIAQNATDLPKSVTELKKWNEDAGKQIQAAAEQVKKCYAAVQEVCKTVEDLQKCYERVCVDGPAEKLTKIKDLLIAANLKADIAELIKQAQDAVMVVVQAASIHALNNVNGFESVVTTVKSQADSLKKDVDGNFEGSSKKVIEWQKSYNTTLTTTQTAINEYGKAKSVKIANEKTYCFLNTSLIKGTLPESDTVDHSNALKCTYDTAKQNYNPKKSEPKNGTVTSHN